MNELERTDKYTVKEMDNEEVFEPLFVHSETKNVDIGLLYETHYRLSKWMKFQN